MNSIKKEIEKRLYEYIVDIAGLKETLLNMNVSLSFKYEGHFHFKDEFLKSLLLKNPQINIRVETREEELGEVVQFYFNDDFQFEVPTFINAELSYGKIETRFVLQLYKYIRKKVNK